MGESPIEEEGGATSTVFKQGQRVIVFLRSKTQARNTSGQVQQQLHQLCLRACFTFQCKRPPDGSWPRARKQLMLSSFRFAHSLRSALWWVVELVRASGVWGQRVFVSGWVVSVEMAGQGGEPGIWLQVLHSRLLEVSVSCQRVCDICGAIVVTHFFAQVRRRGGNRCHQELNYGEGRACYFRNQEANCSIQQWDQST